MSDIAILGATSHIARGLLYNFCRTGRYELFLFARSPESVKQFLSGIECHRDVHVQQLQEFNNGKYDVVINCIGIGNVAKLKNREREIFLLTEMADALVLDYLNVHPETLCVNFSSGAVYGKEFHAPADDATTAVLEVNHILPNDYYRIAKINSEAKHRAFQHLNIVDLRVFAYFSRFLDLESHFFIAEALSCIKMKKIFVTGSQNMVRDYIHPKDLLSLIEKCIERRRLNDVFDALSLRPVTKFEILDFFATAFGLKYRVDDTVGIYNVTGNKEMYYSAGTRAQEIGYVPLFSSMDSIVDESSAILRTASFFRGMHA